MVRFWGKLWGVVQQYRLSDTLPISPTYHEIAMSLMLITFAAHWGRRDRNKWCGHATFRYYGEFWHALSPTNLTRAPADKCNLPIICGIPHTHAQKGHVKRHASNKFCTEQQQHHQDGLNSSFLYSLSRKGLLPIRQKTYIDIFEHIINGITIHKLKCWVGWLRIQWCSGGWPTFSRGNNVINYKMSSSNVIVDTIWCHTLPHHGLGWILKIGLIFISFCLVYQ